MQFHARGGRGGGGLEALGSVKPFKKGGLIVNTLYETAIVIIICVATIFMYPSLDVFIIYDSNLFTLCYLRRSIMGNVDIFPSFGSRIINQLYHPGTFIFLAMETPCVLKHDKLEGAFQTRNLGIFSYY